MTKRFMQKFKVGNITYCPRFTLKGCCKKPNCSFFHDQNKIVLCQKYFIISFYWLSDLILIQIYRFVMLGKCDLVECHKIHKKIPEMMPDCQFFLKNCCNTDNCCYRHVKVNNNAVLCSNFADGFCSYGLEVKI